jgi:hypothetical protein
MKNTKILSALLILFATFGFVSCDSEPVDPVFLENWEENNPDVTGGSFQVNIDGQQFTAAFAQAAFEQGILNISGGSSNTGGSVVAVTAMGSQEGTYTAQQTSIMYIPDVAEQLFYANIDINAEPGNNYNGSIIITDIDTVNKTVSGTFSGTVYWSVPGDDMEPVVLTGGTFTDVPYTGNPTPDTNPDAEYFTAVVDGVEKDFTNIQASVTGENVQIIGLLLSGEAVQMLIDADIAPGTYQFGSASATTIAYQNLSDAYPFDQGSLTITNNSGGFITGTFSFTGTNFDDETIEVTGEFNVEL